MADRRDGQCTGDSGRSRSGHVGPGPRRGMFVAGLLVAVLGAVLPAWAHGPESGSNPNVTLTVNPDTASDQQVVMVTGAGFPPNAAGLIRQCAGSIVAPECDTVVSGFFTTTSTGAIDPSPMTVQRVIHTFTTTYNCSVQACALVATAGGASSQHHITILGAGTSVPTSTSIPTSTSPTTAPTQTTAPPTTTPPTTVPPPTTTLLPPITNLLCAILGPVSALLGGLLDGLLTALGCPPPAS